MTELVMLIRQVLRINEMMTCHFVLLYVNIHQFTTHNFIISKSFNRPFQELLVNQVSLIRNMSTVFKGGKQVICN